MSDEKAKVVGHLQCHNKTTNKKTPAQIMESAGKIKDGAVQIVDDAIGLQMAFQSLASEQKKIHDLLISIQRKARELILQVEGFDNAA